MDSDFRAFDKAGLPASERRKMIAAKYGRVPLR